MEGWEQKDKLYDVLERLWKRNIYTNNHANAKVTRVNWTRGCKIPHINLE